MGTVRDGLSAWRALALGASVSRTEEITVTCTDIEAGGCYRLEFWHARVPLGPIEVWRTSTFAEIGGVVGPVVERLLLFVEPEPDPECAGAIANGWPSAPPPSPDPED